MGELRSPTGVKIEKNPFGHSGQYHASLIIQKRAKLWKLKNQAKGGDINASKELIKLIQGKEE